MTSDITWTVATSFLAIQEEADGIVRHSQYSPDELRDMFDLRIEEAKRLADMVGLEHDFPHYQLQKVPDKDIVEMLGEAYHEGLDGWGPIEQATIMTFMSDILCACSIK